MDSDDEVRDRATFYMNVLQQKQKALNAAYIFNGMLLPSRRDLEPPVSPEIGIVSCRARLYISVLYASL